MSKVYIVQLGQGQKIPNAIMILKIADIFSVDIDQLMGDEFEVD